MFKIVMDGTNIPDEWIKNAIGCGHRQIKKSRDMINDMKFKNSNLPKLKRKQRKDHIREKLKPRIRRYLMDDEITRLDKNQRKVPNIDPSKGSIIQ